MNKVLIVIAFLIVPFFATAKNDTKTEISASKTEVKASIKQEVTIKKYDKITIDPRKQNLDLNFKKSNDIIDVKAYIKSLQLKRKATVIG
ncbi:hypothetical protein U0L90_04425 [Flavobacteriaceae sp. LMIT009]